MAAAVIIVLLVLGGAVGYVFWRQKEEQEALAAATAALGTGATTDMVQNPLAVAASIRRKVNAGGVGAVDVDLHSNPMYCPADGGAGGAGAVGRLPEVKLHANVMYSPADGSAGGARGNATVTNQAFDPNNTHDTSVASPLQFLIPSEGGSAAVVMQQVGGGGYLQVAGSTTGQANAADTVVRGEDAGNHYDMSAPGVNTNRPSAANTLVRQAEIVYAVPGIEAAAAEGDGVYPADAGGVVVGSNNGATAYAVPAAVDSAPLYAVPMKQAKSGGQATTSTTPSKVNIVSVCGDANSDSSDGELAGSEV